MSARRDAPKPSFFRVSRHVIRCNANATLFSTICDYYKVRARFHAFTFCFSEKRETRRRQNRAAPRKPRPAPRRARPPLPPNATLGPSRDARPPILLAECDCEWSARGSRDEAEGIEGILGASTRLSRSVSATRANVSTRRTPRLSSAAFFSSRAFFSPRSEATRASVSTCGARSGAKTHGASLSEEVSEEARRAQRLASARRNAAALRASFADRSSGDAADHALGARCAPGGTGAHPQNATRRSVSAFFSVFASFAPASRSTAIPRSASRAEPLVDS